MVSTILYKLRTNPTNAESLIYNLMLPFFDCCTPEKWIKFHYGVTALLKEQNITSGMANYAVVKTLLKGDTLTFFEAAEVTHVTKSMANDRRVFVLVFCP